jgi:hypothetical protein
MQRTRRHTPTLELLEDRLVPTFNATYSTATSTWALTQVSNSGDVTVAVNATNQVQFTENGGAPVMLGSLLIRRETLNSKRARPLVVSH